MPPTPLRLARFDPSPFGFPKPKVPLLATPAAHADYRQAAGIAGDRLRHFRSFTRGRYALHEAYRLSGIGRGTTLMAPAYHCVTMLDPAIALEADILLYPLTPDLAPDLGRLDALFAAAGSPVKALLATHFFGLAQDFAQLKSWCDANGIALVEDCSHVLFTEAFQAKGTGGFGRYVTASPYKFFPCEDGGLLYAADEGLLDGTVPVRPGLIDEFRGVKRVLEKLWTRTPTPGIEPMLAHLSQLAGGPPAATELQYSDYLQPSALYDDSESGRMALRLSHRLTLTLGLDSIAGPRRRNYGRWLEAVASLPNCHPLYPVLPDDCIPYMFPLVIDRPAPHFFWLKKLGMPIWRWDEMAVSECDVSRHCQLHLLHLPCHQSLSDDEMSWMIAAVQNVLRCDPADGRAGRQSSQQRTETTHA